MKVFIALLSSMIFTLGLTLPVTAADTANANQGIKAEVAAVHAKVNINTADTQELTRLKGIGEKKAEAIIAWRKENGSFKTIDELTEVKGIGEATLEANRDNITL